MINSIINSTSKFSFFIPLSQSLFQGVYNFGCFNVKSSSAQHWRSIVVGSFQSSSLAKTVSTMNQGSTVKPPNLLVLSENVSRFEEVKSCLMQTGFSQCYCIYRLPKDKLLARLWMENCCLLIVLGEEFDERLHKLVEEYLSAPGNVLSFSPILLQSNGRAVTDEIFVEVFLEDKKTGTAKSLFSPNLDNSTNIAVDKSGSPLVQFANLNGGKFAVSGVELFDGIGDDGSREMLTTILGSHFDLKIDASKSAMKWTPIYVHGMNDAKMSQFVKILSNLANSGRLRNLSIADVSLEDDDFNKIPLFLSSNESSFDAKTFRQHLSSSILAQVILYADVLPTTMTILDQVIPYLPFDFSAIVIAAQQSSGLGRSGNAWLSPLGAAMFTLHFSTTLDSELGRRLSVTQHLVALAVVEAVTERIGYENVGIRIKWPNDLFHGQTGVRRHFGKSRRSWEKAFNALSDAVLTLQITNLRPV